MLKRHADTLTQRLEECAITQGWCVIREEELRYWYGQKVTKTVWRDLKDRLNSLLEEPQSFDVYRYDGAVLIVDSEGLEDLKELEN